MRFSVLPPVRRAVPLQRGIPGARASMERFFGSRKITLYGSGTAALAQAIATCAARRPTKNPEVIIPAYGCPDLVTACAHAAVYPRLADVSPSRWSYHPGSLASSLSTNTVAIVTVNLLGLGDDSAELIRLCRERQIPLIQDSAQYLPRENVAWPGEFIVLSFGRGKPLNLLHGGAMISPPGEPDSLAAGPMAYTRRARLLSSRAAAVAFNVLTRPAIYRILAALPGTGLGEVIYKPLTDSSRLPDSAWERVGTAFELYRRQASYRRDIWASALEEWSGLGISALDPANSSPPAEPLRLALLAPDKTARDELVNEFDRAGLGASHFYGSDLAHVAGIPEMVQRQGPFPNARALADRLFTLPTHDLVTAATVSRARDLVRSWHHYQDRTERT